MNIKNENQKEIEKHNLLLKEKDKQIAELEQKLGIKKVQPQPKIKPIIQDKQPKIQKPKPKPVKKAIIPNQTKLPNTNEIFQMMKDNLQKYLSFDVQIPGVNEEHQLETPTGNEKPSSKLVHKNVKCDGCGAFPIEGIRYKCAVCRDFDYCEKCGHQFVDSDACPKCGSEDITRIERMNGYLGYSRVNGRTMYADHKLEEFKDRVSM